MEAKNPNVKEAMEQLGSGGIDYSSPVFGSCSICQFQRFLAKNS